MAEIVSGAERKEMEEEVKAYEESVGDKGVTQYSNPIGPSRREETVSSRGVEQYSHSAGPSREDYEENQRREESERKKKERKAEFEAERERQKEEREEREEAEKNRKFKSEQEKWNLEQKQKYADEKYQKEQAEILKKNKMPSFQERVGKSVSNVASKIDVDYFGGGKKTPAQQKSIEKGRQWLPQSKGGLNIPSFGGSAPKFSEGSTARRTKRGKQGGTLRGKSSAPIGKAFSTGIGMSGMGLQPTMPRMSVTQPKFAVTSPRMPQPKKIRSTTPSFPKMAFSPPKYGESAFGKAKLGKGGAPRSVGDINLGMGSPFGKKKENPLQPKKKKGGLW